MVRVYNRALSNSEIEKNYKSDIKYYGEEPEEKVLIQYVNNVQLNNSNYSLYEDPNEPGRLVYRGLAKHNHILIDGEEWPILGYELDGTMKLLKPTAYQTPYDESGNRDSNSSTYCIDASATVPDTSDYYGCNSFAKSELFTIPGQSGTVIKDSTLLTVLNNEIYNSFNEKEKSLIVSHNYDVGNTSISENITAASVRDSIKEYQWNGKVGTISAYDVLLGELKNVNTLERFTSNYIYNLITNKQYLWTMNGDSKNTYDVATVSYTQSILSPRRSSRIEQETMNYITMPVIHIRSDVVVTGIGTKIEPFIIK